MKTFNSSGTGKKECPKCNVYVGRMAKECKCGHKFTQMPTKSYKYGAKLPTHNKDLVDEQLMLANRYRNALRRVELDRRNEYNETIKQFEPKILDLDTKINNCTDSLTKIYTDIKTASIKARKKVKPNEEQKQNIDDIKKKRKEYIKQLKELKSQLKNMTDWEKVKETLQSNNKQRKKQLRDEFVELGLGWGTEGEVVRNCNSFGKGKPPRYKEFDGSGVLDIQIQNGITWQDVIDNKSNQIRFKEKRRKEQRNGKITIYGDLQLRLQSKNKEGEICRGGHTPVFTTLPVIIHRPVVGLIKRVRLQIEKVGYQQQWSVIFVVESSNFNQSNNNITKVGCDVGFRKFNDRLRVAYFVSEEWVDEKSNYEDQQQFEQLLIDKGLLYELSIPNEIVDRYKKIDDLQAITDKNANTIKQQLLDWKKSTKLSDEIKDELSHLHVWKDNEKIYQFVLKYRDILPEEFEQWRKQHRHLIEWMRNLKRKIVLRRNQLYYCFIKQLEHQFGIVKLEELNIKQLTAKPKPDEADILRPIHRRYAGIASIYKLTQMLENSSLIVEKVEAKYTTQDCPFCGHRNKIKDEVEIECENCHYRYDRDFAGGANIVARGPVTQKSQKPLATVTP